MKAETRFFSTTKTQTLKDAIAFGEYLRELNPNYNPILENFMKTLPPEMLLDSEEFDLLWFNHLDKLPLSELTSEAERKACLA